MSSVDIGLDNPIFAGRLRGLDRSAAYKPRPTVPVRPRGISDIFASQPTKKTPAPAAPASTSPTITTARVARTTSSVPTLPRQGKSQVLQRQSLTKPTAQSASRPRSSKSRLSSQLALRSLAVTLVLAGSFVAYWGWRTNQHVAAQVQGVQNQHTNTDSGVPSEDKPSDGVYRGYRVAGDLPHYVRIPKLKTAAMVQRMSTNSKGALQAPSNVHYAGWYDGSSKPGEGGAVLLDGHVAGPTQHGVFYDLKKLGAGDLIEVERGDGQTFAYKVVKKQNFPANKVDMTSALLPVIDGKPGLNLITCTGNVKGMHYDERLIVYAVQVN